MNFKNLFDTYTKNLSTDERSNEFAGMELTSPETIQSLKQFVENYDSNEIFETENDPSSQDSNINKDESASIDSNSSTPPIAEISDNVLDILSDLDSPAEYMQTKENIDEPSEEITNDTDNSAIENNADDPFANLNDEISQSEEIEEISDDFNTDFLAEENFDDLVNDNEFINTEELQNNDLLASMEDLLDTDDSINTEESNFNDDFSLENNLDDEIENNNDSNSIDNINTPLIEESDDLDLSDFLGAFDEDNNSETPIDDIEDTFFDEEIEDSILNSDSGMFDIELPEEFPTENNEEISSPDITLENSMDMPDFSDTELEEDNSLPPASADLENPITYESVDKSINFDVWNKAGASSDPLPDDDFTEINEEQAFKIRYKINSLLNKDLRFKIREIITNPVGFPEYYNQLVSLLLIDAPEESIVDFLHHIDDDDESTEGIQLSIPTKHIPSFLAHDVVDYQNTIDNIKNELLYNLKKYALYGIITILAGVIAWLGVAQPMRVNGIFEQGLTAVRNNQFIEGEALFQQANNIAGSPVADWYLKYAEVYKDKNLINEASDKYLSAIIIDPKNIDISTKASDFYTNLGPQYFSNAISIMDKLSEYHPKEFEVWDYLGSLFIDYSDFFIDDRNTQTTLLYDATDIYQEYILNNPQNPAPFYRILDIYIRIGNKEQIDKIANILAELNPKTINIQMMTHLAEYYVNNRNLNRATTIFNRLTPILDSSFNDTTSLQKSMERLYNIDPNNISNIMSDSYFEFARYKMLSSDFRSAGIMLTNSILFNPDKEESYNLLGEAYLRSSEPTETKLTKAKELFDQVLDQNPNNFKAHVNLGHMYYVWDDVYGSVDKAHDTALYHYKLASSLMPPNIKNTLMSYNYGWLEYKNNNPNAAIDIWSEIYKNNPDNPILSYALGSALYQHQNPQLAQVILEKSANNLEALKKHIPNPDLNNRRHREIYTQLAKTYNNIGVINAHYGQANRSRQEQFDSQALLNFYKAQDLADKVNNIYSTVEYNIGVLTRPNIRNRETLFDNDIPKQTSLENPVSQFNQLLLETI